MKQEIENVITFLEENEQYGDDWSKEIKVLKKISKLVIMYLSLIPILM